MAKDDFQLWRMEFLHPAMWHDHDIDFARWLHPAMWHVDLESWQWIHQVAAPCNVTRSSGILTLNYPGGSTLQCGRCLWDDMTWNTPKRPPYWNCTSGFDFDISPQSTYHFAPVCKIFIQIGGPSAERNVDFQDGGSPPSWVLGVQ